MEKIEKEKFNLIKKIFLVSLLAASSFAAGVSGEYCIGAGFGTLVAHYVPIKAKANQGTMTVYNSGRCMGPKRPYKLVGNNIISGGLTATFDANNVYITEPQNWSGTWSKSRCSGVKLVDPC